MYLEQKDIIQAPIEKVFPLVRDDMSKIVPYLPNIDRIDIIERKEEGNIVHQVNHWYAKVEVPTVAKKFVKPELFSWKDTAAWDNENFLVNYEMASHWANDLYEAKGQNRFVKISDNETELIVTCDLTIHAERVPGVPKFLVKKVLPAIENLIEKVLGPNLTMLGKGLNEYFQQH